MAMFDKRKPPKKFASNKPQRKPSPQTTALAMPKPPAPIPVWNPEATASRVSPAGSSLFKGFSREDHSVAKSKFDPEKEFMKAFQSLTYQHRAWDVWNDFIIMAACGLSNPVDKTHYDEREARYLRIIRKYNKDEQNKFPELFAHLVLALELNPEQDFLGKFYTSLGLQDDGRKQHFTPYSICQAMTEITMDDVVEQVNSNGYITINDPCCGAGATLIASAHTAKKKLTEIGLNFQNHILVAAQDIDETVALMCYIQLSLLGVAAYIKVGNALTEPMNTGDTMENYWFTPMYFSDVWAMRRLVRKMDDLLQPNTPPKLGGEKRPFKMRVKLDKNDCYCDIPKFYENVARKAGFDISGKVIYNCTKIRCTAAVQDAVFSFCTEERHETGESIAMLWVSCGPKTDLDGAGYAAEIEDGFVVGAR